MDREEAAKELMAMLEEAQEGPYYSEEEVRAHLLEILAPRNQVYMTGDTHGQFERVIEFCARREVEPENTFVILGDAGLNYYNDRRDRKKKDQLAQVPITFFCLHGNHEMRPTEELGYEVAEYHGGKVWMQPAYPNILFAIDGEVYDFNGNSCIVIGGAYSVDKYYRLARGWSWFPDEQPSEEIKAKERIIEALNLILQALHHGPDVLCVCKGIVPAIEHILASGSLRQFEQLVSGQVFVDFVNLLLFISCDLVAGDIVFHLVRAVKQPFKIIEIPGNIEALQSKTILSAVKSACKQKLLRALSQVIKANCPCSVHPILQQSNKTA